jgi:hypothetical protein
LGQKIYLKNYNEKFSNLFKNILNKKNYKAAVVVSFEHCNFELKVHRISDLNWRNESQRLNRHLGSSLKPLSFQKV